MKRSRPKASTNGTTAHAVNGHSAVTPELRLLESLLTDSNPSHALIQRWMQRNLSRRGVLLADPLQTPAAAAALQGIHANGDVTFAKRLHLLSESAARIAPTKVAVPQKAKSFGMVDPQAKCVVLRRSPIPNATMLAVDFRKPECRIALRVAGETVADGAFTTTIDKNGREVPLSAPWEIVCDSADSDMEYLELATSIAKDVYLDRHLLVARKAPILWMVDVLRGDERADWRWSVRWGGFKPTGLRGEAAHRGQRLLGQSIPTALLPVSSPSDPFSKGGMKVAFRDGALELSQEESGKRLVAAAAFVWSETGVLSLPPWRRLTVTNDGRVVPAEEAFAFRVQADSKQCIFFRALERPRRHAFLGCQTFDETIIGELDKKGDVRPWLRIE
jgi:hypothetical protein